ncbi:hypothetical protein CYMTET_22469, partial [Cymbomonas tetramitiformis]
VRGSLPDVASGSAIRGRARKAPPAPEPHTRRLAPVLQATAAEPRQATQGAAGAGDAGLSEMLAAVEQQHAATSRVVGHGRGCWFYGEGELVPSMQACTGSAESGQRQKHLEAERSLAPPAESQFGGGRQHPSSHPGRIIITRQEMSKRQKLYMPKMDTEMERIWPDPSVHMHSEHSKHMRGKEAAAAMWEVLCPPP